MYQCHAGIAWNPMRTCALPRSVPSLSARSLIGRPHGGAQRPTCPVAATRSRSRHFNLIHEPSEPLARVRGAVQGAQAGGGSPRLPCLRFRVSATRLAAQNASKAVSIRIGALI